jgi:hypothetical protein
MIEVNLNKRQIVVDIIKAVVNNASGPLPKLESWMAEFFDAEGLIEAIIMSGAEHPGWSFVSISGDAFLLRNLPSAGPFLLRELLPVNSPFRVNQALGEVSERAPYDEDDLIDLAQCLVDAFERTGTPIAIPPEITSEIAEAVLNACIDHDPGGWEDYRLCGFSKELYEFIAIEVQNLELRSLHATRAMIAEVIGLANARANQEEDK